MVDSSVAINVVASGCAEEILVALPNEILAVDAIPRELARGRQRGRPHADLFDELLAAGHVTLVQLDDASGKLFEEMVIGHATTTLDDGEAATLAYADGGDAIAVLDDRKAIRIGSERFPHRGVACTGDLLAHPLVEAALGRDRLARAVHGALSEGRMRVLPGHVPWLVGLIGADKASSCRSLSVRTRRQISGLR